jgi:G:T-mismatch repair DNA endonuclease (very short patch repair protein)
MESQYRTKGNYICCECETKTSEKGYAISRHVGKHGLTLENYVEKYYKLIDGEIQVCGFCDRNAVPNYVIDHVNKIYSINYKDGFFCRTLDCKNLISLDILGHEYISKKFEKIGSRSEYLQKLYKIDLTEAKSLKYKKPEKKFNCSEIEFIEKYGEEEGKFRYNKRKELISKNNPKNQFVCTKENFIERYGEELGTKKYIDRCNKISYTSSKDFFINKHGSEKGEEIWKRKFKSIKTSKKSKIIEKLLNLLNIDFEKEKNILNKFVDYFLKESNIVIEFYGDYWHANPKRFDKDYYNTRLKATSLEIWEKDKERIDKIKQNVDSIIIIWESSEINDTILENAINTVKNKNTIIYI